jgi:hypothetical protein
MRRLLPDPVVRMTQFYRQKDTGAQFTGSCSQTALAVCLAAAQGTPGDFEGVGELMHALTHDMIQHDLAAPNGAARLAALATQARRAGGIVALEWPYDEPLRQAWRQTLETYAGLQPILLQVARGELLRDAETGRSDEAGLRYHAIAIVGVQDDAVLAVDGDHPEVTRRFQAYSFATVNDAIPCGLLMLAMQRDV